MKRYWKIIAIVTVVVLTIGTFYIQSALSAGSHPEVIIKKESGNKEAVDPVVLQGSYQKVVNGPSDNITLTAKGSTFNDKQSFFERFRGFNSTEIRELQDKYRSFMRGKSGNISSFYEEEDNLAYVDVVNQPVWESPSEMEFDIEVLDKEQDETTSFTVPVPNRAMYSQVYVEDVQMIDGKLKVITHNYLKQGGKDRFNSGRKHLYSFDVSKQDINGEEKIVSTEDEDKNLRTHVTKMPESDRTGANDYVVFRKSQESVQPEATSNQSTVTEEPVNKSKQEYIVYDLETGEKKSLNLPEALPNKEVLPYEGANLYFMVNSENNRKIVGYNMKSGKVEKKIKLPSNSTDKMEGETHSIVKISNEKIYVLSTKVGQKITQGTQHISVIDINKGETLYRGEITTKEPSVGEYLHFYNMKIE